MSPTTTDTPLGRLRAAVEDSAAALAPSAAASKARPTLERPKKAEFGDFSTNAAMLLAPAVGAPPRDVAEKLAAELSTRLGDELVRTDVAGPGFLNLFLSDGWYAGALEALLAAGDAFGGGTVEQPERQNVEFVSANPTGPMHLGHARNAAYGDALSRILGFHGHDVFREFYVNDAGSQVQKLAESVQARARGEDVPEDGYKGDYIVEVAQEIPDAATRPLEEVGREAIERMLDRMRATLEAFGVHFDQFFSERTLHEGEPSEVDRAFDALRERGHLYESDGALWVRTTEFGDDKDRVVRRSNGELTYFASDIAYHWDKRERGFERMFDVWGADHHGYVQRMKAAYAALGGDPDQLELLIMQFVHLKSSGEALKMSKRAGDFVTLDDLVAEIGVDAARWFLLHRSHDTTVEVDLDLATQETKQNPVYYVQYAHARIASLRRKAEAEGAAPALEALPRVTLEPAERQLIQRLLAFPAEIAEASDRRAPHRIATYAHDLAQDFTAFYEACKVLGAGRDTEAFRLALMVAAQRTIARSLDLLGVSAPESM
jgi:arginyl-tRNA synthetase